jgi:Uma2 family endonuclease
LVVEVMESSAGYDREVKVPLYARSGIPETWLVDLEQGQIEVSRAPGPEIYRDVHRVGRGEHLAPQAFPQLILRADEVFGP